MPFVSDTWLVWLIQEYRQLYAQKMDSNLFTDTNVFALHCQVVLKRKTCNPDHILFDIFVLLIQPFLLPLPLVFGGDAGEGLTLR